MRGIRFLLLVFSMLSFYFSYGQFFEQEKDTMKLRKIRENLLLGGDFQVSFGTVTDIYLSPTVGYMLGSRVMIGGSLKFEYYKIKLLNRQDINYGASVFTEVFPFKFVVLHSEFVGLNMTNFQTGNRLWVGALYAGGGYRQVLGSKAMANYMVLFNVLKVPYFPNYWYRVLILF